MFFVSRGLDGPGWPERARAKAREVLGQPMHILVVLVVIIPDPQDLGLGEQFGMDYSFAVEGCHEWLHIVKAKQ